MAIRSVVPGIVLGAARGGARIAVLLGAILLAGCGREEAEDRPRPASASAAPTAPAPHGRDLASPAADAGAPASPSPSKITGPIPSGRILDDRVLVDTDGDGRIDLQMIWTGSVDATLIKVDRDHDGRFDAAWAIETAAGGDAPDRRSIDEPVPSP